MPTPQPDKPRRVFLVPALAAAALALPACAGSKYRENPRNPFPDIRTIAVLPVQNQSTLQLAPEKLTALGNVLASEIIAFPGFQVIRQEKLKALAYQNGVKELTCMQDAINLAQAAGADAVLCVSVTDWKEYPPPRLALAMELLRTKSVHLGSRDIGQMVQAGRPFPVPSGQEGSVVAAMERTIDSHHASWRGEIEDFASVHADTDYGIMKGGQFYLVDDLFFQFATNWMLREIVAQQAPPSTPASGPMAHR